jgi:hypothetical protein
MLSVQLRHVLCVPQFVPQVIPGALRGGLGEGGGGSERLLGN